MQQGKHTSCNGGQSAGLPKARVPAPVGGGGQNDATATDDDGNNAALSRNGTGQGGGVADAAQRSEHSAARHRLPISLHGERIARAMHKNGVVVLVGSMGSGKWMQIRQ